MKNLLSIIVVAVIVAVVTTIINRQMPSPAEVVHDTITIITHDTITIRNPLPVRSEVVRYVKVPVTDTIIVHSTDTVTLPITQKVYSNSSYTAYVSGFSPSLDSIIFYQQNTMTSIMSVPKPKKWSVGLSLGYGFSNHGKSPFIGISLQRKLFEF